MVDHTDQELIQEDIFFLLSFLLKIQGKRSTGKEISPGTGTC